MMDRKSDLEVTRSLHNKFILESTVGLLNRAGLQPDDEWIGMVNRAIENREPDKLMMAYPLFYMQTCMAKAEQLGSQGKFEEGHKWALEGVRMGQDALFGRVQIVANVANGFVDYLISDLSEEKMDEYQAIATITQRMRPDPPQNWPNLSDEDKMKVGAADRNLAKAGSDGIVLFSEVNLCRHARSITYDICEMRNMAPYSCSMRMENEKGETSGHAIVVVFENDENGNQRPVFIDGHNALVDKGIESLAARWGKVGWKLTSCRAERMMDGEKERQEDGSMKTINSKWDTKQLL